MTEATADELWVLNEAADPRGFQPHAASTVRLVLDLEKRGWIVESLNHEVWYIAPEGRAVLQRHFGVET